MSDTENAGMIKRTTWPGFSRVGEGGIPDAPWSGNLASAFLSSDVKLSVEFYYLESLPSLNDIARESLTSYMARGW